MENSIEETIKQLELILKVRKEQKDIIECAGGSCINCDPDIKALTESINILSDYKRVLKENEELTISNKEIDKECSRLEAKEKSRNIEPVLINNKMYFIDKNLYEDLLNDIKSNYIKTQKVKDKIEEEIKYHEKNILDIENVTMLKSKTAKEEAEIEFNKYAIVILKKMLRELIENND